MKFPFCLLFPAIPLAAISSAAPVGNHLLPETGMFDNLYAMVDSWPLVQDAVTKNLRHHALAKYYCIPAFSGPYAFALQEDEGGYLLQGSVLSKSFTEIVFSSDFETIQYEQQIDDHIALRIIAIWRTHLLRTQYPEDPEPYAQPEDGAWYCFSAFVDGSGILSGTIHSPREEHTPIPYFLVTLADAVFSYLKSGSDSGLQEIETLLIRIENES